MHGTLIKDRRVKKHIEVGVAAQGPSLHDLILIDRSEVNIFNQIRRLNETPMCSLLQERYMQPF
jgi:hypothetical protein